MVNEITPTSREKRNKLCHLRHALPVQPDFANTLYPCEDIINSLAAESHQFSADDARNEVTRQIQNLLRRGAVEALAKNGRHRASQRLHFRSERHANLCLALVIHVQINADCVGAFLVLPNIDEIKILALARFLPCRIICIRNECFAPLIFGKRFKEFDDVAQLRRIHRVKIYWRSVSCHAR
jgi:hypothetical protein